ncbi:SsrA-binding protein SmpB [Mycoplasmoides alvi]|uniref:SsrA-binding protein SmpB n=1 Tax=Mycoplasmoides alvi TaxID=78580 RepID=UPI00051C751E|nr:SsrA-binding protein SmpB [Mycoplasmoides alvi]
MKILVNNKKANFNYSIIATYEAGIVLTGSEVKSLSESHGNLNEAFVIIRRMEMFLLNFNIPKYKFNTVKNHEETRTRKLLMHKYEIRKIELKKKQEKLTLIPLMIYWKNKKIKVKIALAKGRKKHDKREILKMRDDIKTIKSY